MGCVTAKVQEEVVYLAWGKGTKDDLLCDQMGLVISPLFLIFIVILSGGNGKFVGKLQAAAAVVVLEFSTKREPFYMDLDVRRRHNGLLSPWIHDKTPVLLFQC